MEKIYKYLSAKDAIKTIENNSVALRNPNTYNDPFDSFIEIKDSEEIKSFNLIIEFYIFYSFIKLLNSGKLKMTRFQKIQLRIFRTLMNFYINLIKKEGYFSNPFLSWFVKKYLYNNKNEKIIKEVNDKKTEFVGSISKIVNEIKESALVSCFSKKSDSILMWSHYANKHQGVCLEFQRPEDDFFDVVYQSERVTFNLYRITSKVLGHMLKSENIDSNNIDFNSVMTDDEFIKKVLTPFLVKSSHWKYEEEVRCIFSKKENNERITLSNEGIFLYNMPYMITKIILGCKIDPNYELKIRDLFQKLNIPIVKMRTSDNRFILEEQLDSIDNKLLF